MLRPGHVVILCVVALLTLGVVMVNSAGQTIDPKRAVTLETLLLSRSTIYMGLALLGMGAVALLVPLQRLDGIGVRNESGELSGWSMGRLWVATGLLLCVLAVVYLPGLGAAKKGQHRWIELRLPGLGELSVQPSEIAKWLLVVVMAWYAATMGRRLGNFFTGLVPALGVVGVVSGFVALADLGTAVLLAVVAVTILLAGGAKFWHFLIMLPPAGLAFAAAVIAQPYRWQRITSFMHPYADPQGKGYHMIQSMLAIANGEVFGRGLGHGLQKFDYLPEDTTDFLFAIICEELGLFGAVLVVGLYCGVMLSGLAIVRRQATPMFKLVGLGVLTTVGVQALINLAVVTGLAPTKGIALPLLSSGGTGWILTACSLGLLVAMDRLRAPDEAHVRAAIDSGGTLIALPRAPAARA